VSWDGSALVFGTDGLRGLAGAPPIDPETLRRVGAALGVWLQRSGGEQKRVLVGNDGRESAAWILEALAQGLAAADVAVADVGLVTTPALAFLSRSQPVDAGIMLSASHNPAHDNGIKILDHRGNKLADEAERSIETLAADLRPEAVRTPRIRERLDLLRSYEDHLANAFPDLDLTGLRIVADAANGGGAQLLPSVLRSFGAEVIAVACEPDGTNINDGTGALHPEHLKSHVLAHGAALGVCLDGDGDRSMFVDETGTVRDGDDQLAAFGPWLLGRGDLPHRTVVATVMSNFGLHRALAGAGITVQVTPVGDRNVSQAMRQGGFALGGEQSGHILFAGAGNLTGDGLFTALQLCSLPSVKQRGFAQAFARFQRLPQRLCNVKVRHKPELASVPAIARQTEITVAQLGDAGRLLLRYSGTEPLCRVMIEGPDAQQVERLCRELAAVIEAELG